MRTNFPATLAFTLADPFPGGLGMRFSRQVTRWIRAHGGVSFSGSSSTSLTNYGVGAQLLHPDWEVSPYFGTSTTIVIQSGSGTISSFDGDGWHLYPTVGLDWQSPQGFSVQVGYHLAIRAGLRSTLTAALGWSFDL